jgi:serine/threonine protein kinase
MKKMFSSCRKWLVLLAQTAQAIFYLHSQAQPILHRDIKPGNVLVSEQHQPLVADFGLACDASSNTEPCQGTYNYLAPELFMGKIASRQTDVYAFALFMWFVASGAESKGAEPCPEPWAGDLFQDVMERVTGGQRPAWPPDVEKLSSLVRFRKVGPPGCVSVLRAKLRPLTLVFFSLSTGAGTKSRTSAPRLGSWPTRLSAWRTSFVRNKPSCRPALA